MESRKSKFCWRDLEYCDKPASRSCPLRVVAHIDQDAFYAQVEIVRLGISPSTPFAVQQWQGLIAVNYPARAANVSRHETITEAKKKCPELQVAHVKTWKAGDTEAKYHENPDPSNFKACLDPYRHESVKILNIIKKHAPIVKKASIDECFIELTAEVKRLILEDYPFLKTSPENLETPLPAAPVLLWTQDYGLLIDRREGDTNGEYEQDWDDVFLYYAARIVKEIRDDIYKSLHYTCSAGVSFNPMLAKLVSSRNKPNKQAVLCRSGIKDYLGSLSITDIRMLGGKFGEEVVRILGTDSISDVWSMQLDDIMGKLGQVNGRLVWNMCHGLDDTEITTQIQIKSMLSAKNFSHNKLKDENAVTNWFRVFGSDLHSRFLELEGLRRPKTLCLHALTGFLRKSRSTQIPLDADITVDYIANHCLKLLRQLQDEYDVYPISHLSVSFQNIVENDKSSRGIESFLRPSNKVTPKPIPMLDDSSKIHLDANSTPPSQCLTEEMPEEVSPNKERSVFGMFKDISENSSSVAQKSYTCKECGHNISFSQKREHDDYHFAINLSRNERLFERQTSSAGADKPANSAKSRTYGRKTGNKHFIAPMDSPSPKKAFLDAFFTANQNTPSTLRKKTSPNNSSNSSSATQLHLDLGSTTVTCSECLMEYNKATEEDVDLHSRFHSRTLGGIDLNMQAEPIKRLSYSVNGDSIYMVTAESALLDQKKAEDAVNFVNEELSGEPMETIGIDKYSIFLFMSGKKCIGLLLAERIKSAYVISEKEDEKTFFSSAVYIKENKLKHGFILGVSRIWVTPSRRKQGIARALLDCATSHFIYGYKISNKEIAFTQPSESGKRFIISWSRAQQEDKTGVQYAVYES
ncbi:sister chromatid cohesion protein/DNA polymerase eta Eso1 [Schizosaccharomyces cryophilus OY26]|uniref:DNA polymerase eta n=1 Tax=Schizosaccharomyces cryophilus (strain OY26 / ATCC MYA-4695 / CBS 11777 / NBRC 106824 / NRRL Y48691) TaxID=653667 RepID=S9WZX1_SCHCR|nr:sister chromatid cohesion protein/DNA polymerase eta Eso1 [Schizosaccharomyces cryophilus OY26]EPY50262.1 sister chromatid cohesion protein/DNA polymerase eta Eso1 [Schizosaccharomyces cryophilus OY26]